MGWWVDGYTPYLSASGVLTMGTIQILVPLPTYIPFYTIARIMQFALSFIGLMAPGWKVVRYNFAKTLIPSQKKIK